jgi:hypothetical protein
VKNFLYAVAEMGLPCFSVKDLEQVRLLPFVVVNIPPLRGPPPTPPPGFIYSSAAHHPPTPVQHMQTPPSSTPTPIEAPKSGCGKKQKAKSGIPSEGFHEKYLKLKREEIDRFASIEEKKLEDPYSINKCIIVLEGLNGIHIGHILMASDISKSRDNMKVFLSFTSVALRLAWIKSEIGRLEVENQN